MDAGDKQAGLGRILELMKIINLGVYSDYKKVKVFREEDIYRKSQSEVTILESSKKHRYSFIKRMKAKIELYEICFENQDDIIKNL